VYALNVWWQWRWRWQFFLTVFFGTRDMVKVTKRTASRRHDFVVKGTVIPHFVEKNHFP
jgi:hypothetical protein